MAKEKEKKATGTRTGAAPKVKWDDSGMKSSYANVCNVTSTREEMTLYFGTNQTIYTGQEEVTVQLSDRVILNPYAAKRLLLLLNNVVGEYEKRYGALDLSLGGAPTKVDPSAN